MSGKTTLAELLKDRGFARVALAGPVKDGVVAMLNALNVYLDRVPDMTREKLERDKAQLRPLLQIVGTEIGRQYLGPDTIWIDRFLSTVADIDGPVVCDDVRFANEAEALLAAGFKIYRVHRNETARGRLMLARYGTWDKVAEVMAHPSEAEALTLPISGVIENPEVREGEMLTALLRAADRIAAGEDPCS